MATALLNGRGAAAGGIASGIPVRRIVRSGLRVHGRASTGISAVGIQRGAFSTTTGRRISDAEIDALRHEIGQQERTERVNEVPAKEESGERSGRAHRNVKAKPAISTKALDEEIRWLKDPMKLANRVLNLLIKDGQVEKAAALVRRAQKDGLNCIVAWNHLIDYEMQQGRTESALKFYNDVSYSSSRESAVGTR